MSLYKRYTGETVHVRLELCIVFSCLKVWTIRKFLTYSKQVMSFYVYYQRVDVGHSSNDHGPTSSLLADWDRDKGVLRPPLPVLSLLMGLFTPYFCTSHDISYYVPRKSRLLFNLFQSSSTYWTSVFTGYIDFHL